MPESSLLSLSALPLLFLGSGLNLEGPSSALGALSVLALIVAVHECGHFLAARMQGIHVSKFAIGFGPPLFTYQAKEVEYSLRLIPLGGYVAFPDDNQDRVDETGAKVENPFAPDDPDLLCNRSIPERGLVISAGVMANIAFAYLALLVQVSTVGKAVTEYYPGVKIPSVSQGTAAARAGFQDGDVVLTVDGWKVPGNSQQVSDVIKRIRISGGREMKFQVQRDGTVVDVPCVPDTTADGTGRIGVQIYSNAYFEHIHPKGPIETVALASFEFARLAGVVGNGLQQIVTNFSKMAGQLSGPVAIVAAGSEIARTDSAGLFQFCAIININLAAVNLLPLPALDGGYLLLLLVEALRGGKKLPQEVENGFMASGFLLLTAMGVGLVVRDTIHLIAP